MKRTIPEFTRARRVSHIWAWAFIVWGAGGCIVLLALIAFQAYRITPPEREPSTMALLLERYPTAPIMQLGCAVWVAERPHAAAAGEICKTEQSAGWPNAIPIPVAQNLGGGEAPGE